MSTDFPGAIRSSEEPLPVLEAAEIRVLGSLEHGGGERPAEAAAGAHLTWNVAIWRALVVLLTSSTPTREPPGMVAPLAM